MDILENWNRLIDFLERLGAPKIVRYPEDHQTAFSIESKSFLPAAYVQFVQCFGYPTLFIDDDLCLGFLSPAQIDRHPLSSLGVFPFAVCNPDCQISVAMLPQNEDIVVMAYDGLERIDSEGSFDSWMYNQVHQFLLQLMHYNPQVLQARQFVLGRDPLNLSSANCFEKIS